MAGPNFNLPYPPVLNNNCNLQAIKTVVAAGYATTVNVYTVAQSTVGRFFVTNVIIHDPLVTNATPSCTLAFGSASTSTTSIVPSLWLPMLTGSTTNQYVQVQPSSAFGLGFTQGGALPATTTLTTLTSATPAVAFGPGDVLQVNILTAGNTTTQSYQMDLIGYYV